MNRSIFCRSVSFLLWSYCCHQITKSEMSDVKNKTKRTVPGSVCEITMNPTSTSAWDPLLSVHNRLNHAVKFSQTLILLFHLLAFCVRAEQSTLRIQSDKQHGDFLYRSEGPAMWAVWSAIGRPVVTWAWTSINRVSACSSTSALSYSKVHLCLYHELAPGQIYLIVELSLFTTCSC